MADQLTGLINGTVFALKVEDGCDLHKTVHDCLKTKFLIHGEDNTFHLPKNDAEMKTVCDNMLTAESCATEFVTKCAVDDKEKKSLDHSLHGLIRVAKRFCETEDKKKEFISHVNKCGMAILGDSRKCTDEYKKQLMGSAKLDDKDKIKKVLCCKLNDVPLCMKKSMKEQPAAICNDHDDAYFRHMTDFVKEEMIKNMCTDFDKDFDTKCSDIGSIDFKEKIDDITLTEAMKKVFDKLL
ncbi:hypothetical protein RDWZM_001363 [Blomia tropicalis]|uniref:Uncharacterized protein n=1 Tax=Blomia tropicalis TaxID=40697 RepID=A0A9Q0RNW0_BLOTA|nr:hypothetical protein RDWZM_001363 [Blomia tropicalis]